MYDLNFMSIKSHMTESLFCRIVDTENRIVTYSKMGNSCSFAVGSKILRDSLSRFSTRQTISLITVRYSTGSRGVFEAKAPSQADFSRSKLTYFLTWGEVR